jgi:hypothetical protein
MKELKPAIQDDKQPWDPFILELISPLSQSKTVRLMKGDFSPIQHLETPGIKLSVTYTQVQDALYVGDKKDYSKKEVSTSEGLRNRNKVPQADRTKIKNHCLMYPQMRALIVEPRSLVESIYSKIPEKIAAHLAEAESKAAKSQKRKNTDSQETQQSKVSILHISAMLPYLLVYDVMNYIYYIINICTL